MKVGEIAFIVGIVLAILSGILVGFIPSGWIILALVILGLIVGFLNVTEKETQAFLIAGIALLATGLSGDILATIPIVGRFLAGIVSAISVFVAPAVIVVSIKAIYALARD